jgi:hypothetical protein
MKFSQSHCYEKITPGIKISQWQSTPAIISEWYKMPLTPITEAENQGALYINASLLR